jgi:hypothetical protein
VANQNLKLERTMTINCGRCVLAAAIVAMAGGSSTVSAQEPESKWSAEVGIGWDNGISGNANSSAIGTINNQSVVILRNSYEDVYGTGLHLRFGGGYMLNETTEARVTFTFQSLDADEVVPMGDIGVSNLYGKYSDYQTFGIDFGLRKYSQLRPRLKAYGEGSLGIGFVDKIDVQLVAPGANLTLAANDYYDQTTAFTLGAAAGILAQTNDRVGIFVQMGLRYVSGLSEVDDLVGTGLDSINDKSSRWTLPFIAGVRVGF